MDNQVQGGGVVERPTRHQDPSRRLAFVLFELAVSLPVIGVIAYLLFRHGGWKAEVVLWIVVLSLVDLLPVATWRDVQMLMDFPLIIALALRFPPGVAAFAVLIGSVDPRELKREIGPLRALFNRCQIAASCLGAALVFRELLGVYDRLPRFHVIVGPALVAIVAGYLINVSIVSIGASLLYREPVRRVVKRLRIGAPLTFLVNYLGLGAVGVVIAEFAAQGFWAVLAFLGPVVLTRQLFYRSVALERTRKELAVAYETEAERVRDLEELGREKAEVSSILTHDFLYAHAAIRAAAQALDQRWDQLGDVKRRKLIRGIERESGLARDLAEEVIALMYLDTDDTPVSLVAENVVDLVREAEDAVDELGGRLSVRIDPRAERLVIPVDRARVLQVLRNLLLNAMKYSPENSMVELWVASGDDEVVLGVDDEGPGIEAEDVNKLFKRFSRLSNGDGVPGTGLGLYICRKNVEAHGGRIWVESELGVGSSFRFSIPLTMAGTSS
jgi:signal transduction histidine kinase